MLLVFYIQQYFNTSITVLTNQVWKLLMIALFKVPNTGAFTVPDSTFQFNFKSGIQVIMINIVNIIYRTSWNLQGKVKIWIVSFICKYISPRKVTWTEMLEDNNLERKRVTDSQFLLPPVGIMVNIGPVHKGMNHVPKDVSERDSDPFLIWKPDFTLCECKALSNQAFETWKRGILDHDSRRKPDSRTCERKALLERDSCVRILEMRTEAMHGSISADCAVGTKYYLAVHRSCTWLGRRLQCMWTHVVEITILITKRIAIRSGFRNVIRSFVNRPIVNFIYKSLEIHKGRL